MDKSFILRNLSEIRDLMFRFHKRMQHGSKNKEWAKILLEKTENIIAKAIEAEEEASLRIAFEELTLLLMQAVDENDTFEKWMKGTRTKRKWPLSNID